jgi:hypothetical protein
MLRYLLHLLFGHQLCAACRVYNAGANKLCLYCELKTSLIRPAP